MTSFKKLRLQTYLNQLVQHEARTGNDAYGDPVYGTPLKIAARIEQRPRLVKGANGEDIVATASVWTTDAVSPYDRINGQMVVNVSVLTDRDGSTVGYESYVAGGVQNGA